MSRIRITGGTHRSRLIQVVDAAGLRPTPDRVRETLFNWLGQDLSGWRCLDLFAGSGVLGFEAASRGADEVVLVERDARALQTLKSHLAALPLPKVRIVGGDALKFISDTRFDLIFLDPPYNKGWLDKVAPLLPQAGQRPTPGCTSRPSMRSRRLAHGKRSSVAMPDRSIFTCWNMNRKKRV